MQRNWIGRSEGAEVVFRCEELGIDYPVFTTRPDTLFGVTFFVMAPEHPDVFRLAAGTDREQEVHEHVNRALSESATERGAEDREKTGVPLGRTVTNPVNGEEIPMFVADYVLMEYGTGAIMAVPAHDQRDYDFAVKHGLEVRRVIEPAHEAADPAAPGGEAEEADGITAEPPTPARASEGAAIPGAELDPIALEPDAKLSTEERARLEAEEEERARREAEATAEAPEEEPTAAPRAQLDSGARFRATGKRKRSIARVTLLSGDGKIEVNQRALEEYFPRPQHQTIVRQPLAVTGYEEGVDVRVRVSGGGISGQAGAVRHGVARALTEIDPELRRDLKRRGFLTRDPRVKERRKAGLKKARKRPQFSKR
jgi:ribosomal protein S9